MWYGYSFQNEKQSNTSLQILAFTYWLQNFKTSTAFNAMEATLQEQVKLCKNFVKNVNMYQNNG